MDYIAIISEKDAINFKGILPKEVSSFWIPPKQELASMDLAIKRHLKAIIADKISDADAGEKAKFVLENFDSYCRQYIGIIIRGEKRIFCNAALGPPESKLNWKSEPIIVMDGGAGYWDIQYVPSNSKCLEFSTHGEA